MYIQLEHCACFKGYELRIDVEVEVFDHNVYLNTQTSNIERVDVWSENLQKFCVPSRELEMGLMRYLPKDESFHEVLMEKIRDEVFK